MEHWTSMWENIKNRAHYLVTSGEVPDAFISNASIWAYAICEELGRLEARIAELEKK